VSAEPADTVTCFPVEGVGEVTAGEDLGRTLVEALGTTPATALRHGDVLLVTSKVVSKAEGRLRRATRDDVLREETVHVVARRGATTIVRTRHGLVLAGAGVDGSNTVPGTVLLLPDDADTSARRLRERVRELTGRNVAVVVTDTAGRAWRQGQTDQAIGLAGLPAVLDHAGRRDRHGNELTVTLPAVADEVAGLGDLVKGKLAHRPAAVVRGLDGWVLRAGDHGPGAASLVRDPRQDLFGYGAREAVLRAVRGEPDDLPGFGGPVAAEELVQELAGLPGSVPHLEADLVVVPLPELAGRELGRWESRVEAAAFALGWTPRPGHDPGNRLSFAPGTP
jgi:coenzyme F420-0:L-glutamate ligase / coenzyme F420-1:gamma-L-glutamate ligase